MEFTVYNANVNLFCIVTLTLENSALGEPSLLDILTLACVLLPRGLGFREVGVGVQGHPAMGYESVLP